MTIKIKASVYQGSKKIKLIDGRPVRILNNGIAGIVYKSKAYPVYWFSEEEFRINLDDTSYTPYRLNYHRVISENNCLSKDKWLNLGIIDCSKAPELKNEHSMEWYLEAGFYDYYLMINCNQGILNQFVYELKSSKMKVKRHGESARVADNGVKYNWFIRIGSENNRKKVISQKVLEAG